MPTSEDLEFGKKALDLGFIQSQQLAKSIKIQKKLWLKGKKVKLYWVMFKKGYLDKSQIKYVRKMCEKAVPEEDATIRYNDEKVELVEKEDRIEAYLRTLTRYKILKKIGEGGMSHVFHAFDKNLDREIAFKIMKDEVKEDSNITRFRREALLVGKLRHPNIVMVYDMVHDNDVLFFTMEYVRGSTLRKLMNYKPFSISRSVQIIRKIARAVEFAHNQNIIHRDLKPENIMMQENRVPKVMDFGLAKIADTRSNISRTGMILGTLNYMPPEQAEGRIADINEQSDVYSLGAIFYELLTQQTVFNEAKANKLIIKILQEPPTAPQKINPNIPTSLQKVILKSLQKSQKLRYKTMKEFIYDLERCIKQ
ncbi:serine/threonine protein kinase [Candidatus Uabimicrobium amorphum]|uniref:non-specific serine/threonine protein kinase n=1 Tax=Uabimicrobium amorphum TaxID=2596890 RepID=A0A5S9F133_UABAM|nr:serine/threonine-protein kinase [Candidatus Uabimicrobium amorphum]BBM81992.1 serine/threonine protein kinase [Candidatus Uabimicrobium amorphum]